MSCDNGCCETLLLLSPGAAAAVGEHGEGTPGLRGDLQLLLWVAQWACYQTQLLLLDRRQCLCASEQTHQTTGRWSHLAWHYFKDYRGAKSPTSGRISASFLANFLYILVLLLFQIISFWANSCRFSSAIAKWINLKFDTEICCWDILA